MSDIVEYGATGALTDPAQVKDYYAKYAEAYANTERRAGSSVSIRNGVMTVGDQAVPGNQFAAIILDAARLNTFYNEAFNAQNITPPRCYALSRDESEMAPHPDMQRDLAWFQPQAERCGACPHNEFGSGPTGTGKACSNRRRLLLLVAGVYAQGPQGWVLQPQTDAEYYATAQILTLTVAPTSAPGWGQFVRDAAGQYQRPPFGVVARVHLYTHPKHGKEAVGFEVLAPTPPAWDQVIILRHEEAARQIMEGYEPPEPTPQRGGGFRQAVGQR